MRAENWRQIVGAGGECRPAARQADRAIVETGLTFLAGMSGGADRLEAPLTFADGQMAFGPIPLGPAPRFYIP